jgi:hypothetical protein
MRFWLALIPYLPLEMPPGVSAPGVSPLALRPWGSALGVPMDGLMDRYSPLRGEIDLIDCRRFQKLRGTDVIIIQQGCFDLTAVCRTFFRFLDTPNNLTV